ncbi:Uncharacterized protein PECH_002806 [Penicillium ucsense]|uniref:Dynactin subunit n=1 Tax=Penicillium ucsense TaxID=2839758 RepID=A0A8J8W0R5_9EURO|nr:Uncharacterized protein PECM_007034 [Penicillium ucsense]KAF7730366.1 Uncharacterized protein PECH_002806 [Penicillium ucsense]
MCEVDRKSKEVAAGLRGYSVDDSGNQEEGNLQDATKQVDKAWINLGVTLSSGPACGSVFPRLDTVPKESLELSAFITTAPPIPPSPQLSALFLFPANNHIAMAFNKKYAGLPDLDPSPDIYETPDLTDEASTIPATTIRTDSDHEDAGYNSDIDREGVNADQARLHFMGAAVDARGANFSDSISTKRQAYRTREKSRRRRRIREDGTEEVGDLSDSEDESLERRLARLRREVEDLKLQMENRAGSGREDGSTSMCKGQAAHSHADGADTAGQTTASLGDGVAELSRALDNLHASSRVNAPGSHYSAATFLTRKLASEMPSAGSQTRKPEPEPASTGETTISAVTPVSSQTAAAAAGVPSPQPSAGLLSHAVAFEERLALLESSIGISTSSNPFVGDAFSEPALQPVLPTLDQMTSRLSALTGLLMGSNYPAAGGSHPNAGVAASTTPNLEALSSRIRKMTADADALAFSRKRAADAAKAAQTARIASGSSDADALPPTSADGSNSSDDDQIAKIQALYTTLPTIQSLHPLLPSVLDRLRSLRACHAGAAHAAESLNELEKRHAEMATEIDQWREGLTAVEERMKQGEEALRSNVDTVEPWVRDLEARMARLEGSTGVL